MKKLVLADYFLGFSTRVVSGGARPWRLYYESEEDAGLKPPRCNAAFSGDLYLSGDIKDIASTYYPAIAPYDVEDPDVAEYHVLLAKAAGIDGFMAEFTLGQEKKLLTLVNAAKEHDFKIGVNWITQSHLAENTWPDRAAAIAKAHELVRWMVEHVYKPCGVRYHDRYLLLAFLAHPREAAKPFDPFFSPMEIAALKQTAIDAGCDLEIFTLPWEALPEDGKKDRVWDGYFPWVWSSSGASIGEDACWSRMTTRLQYIDRLRDYYAMCRRIQEHGRIGGFIGAVCPGFDDHKGQAWGEGLKRYLPRDDGQTYRDTWRELREAGVDAALIITWNDWVESSQIEPSLELGDEELVQTAVEIADWKSCGPNIQLLKLPRQVLHLRRELRLCAIAGVPGDLVKPIQRQLDQVASAIASANLRDLQSGLDEVKSSIDRLRALLTIRPIHLFWEFGFDLVGIRQVPTDPLEKVLADTHTGVRIGGSHHRIGFALDAPARADMRGHVVARLALDYLDSGEDFVRVNVDAADEAHREIASFKKTDTGRWVSASMELVNARFAGGLAGGADIEVLQRPGTAGGVRALRIDGVYYLHNHLKHCAETICV